MTNRTHAVDSGGVSRLGKRWFAVDSGGVSRLAQRVFVIDSGGVARLIHNGDQITIGNMLARAQTIQPTTAVASYSLASDGDIDATNNSNVVVDRGDWIIPKTNMALYEARMTTVSGSLTSGTIGSWLALNVTRTWENTRSGIGAGTTTYVGTLEIRRASDGLVMGTATITIEAEVT
jgi:hypothetical protein